MYLYLGGINSNDSDAFISFLEHQRNVELRGIVNSEQLQEQMKEADLFWLCWKIGVNALWDGSNSHKILEYLSTGKPVVAHHVSSYLNTDLLYMLHEKDNARYTELFHETIEQVKNGERKEIIFKRLATSVENSYSKKIQHIENLINYG